MHRTGSPIQASSEVRPERSGLGERPPRSSAGLKMRSRSTWSAVYSESRRGADQPVREHWQMRANLRLSAAWPARPAPLKPHWPTSSSSAVPSALGADRGPVRMERPPRLRRGVVLVLAVGRRQRVEAIRSLAHRAPVFGSNAGVARRITSSHTRLDLEGAYAELPV
jgi:hypothetical protein